MNVKNRYSGLEIYISKKKSDAREKAVATIQRLVRMGSVINFNSVSTESGLSKTYLYNNIEIRGEIERIRAMQAATPKEARPRIVTTDKSKDILLSAFQKKIKELTNENTQLKNELKILRGKLYEKL